MKYLLTLLVLMPKLALADVWAERALLERYMHQLEELNKTLLVDAQQVSDPNARISMNYPALMRDSQEIINKIRHHLESPLEEYRSIPVMIDTEQVSNYE